MIKPNNYYSVQEAADLIGISKETLLKYEKEGKIPPAKRNPINKWRQYTDGDIEQIRRITGRL